MQKLAVLAVSTAESGVHDYVSHSGNAITEYSNADYGVRTREETHYLSEGISDLLERVEQAGKWLDDCML